MRCSVIARPARGDHMCCSNRRKWRNWAHDYEDCGHADDVAGAPDLGRPPDARRWHNAKQRWLDDISEVSAGFVPTVRWCSRKPPGGLPVTDVGFTGRPVQEVSSTQGTELPGRICWMTRSGWLILLRLGTILHHESHAFTPIDITVPLAKINNGSRLQFRMLMIVIETIVISFGRRSYDLPWY